MVPVEKSTEGIVQYVANRGSIVRDHCQLFMDAYSSIVAHQGKFGVLPNSRHPVEDVSSQLQRISANAGSHSNLTLDYILMDVSYYL